MQAHCVTVWCNPSMNAAPQRRLSRRQREPLMESVSVIYMIIMQVYIMHGFLPSWSQVCCRACFLQSSCAPSYIFTGQLNFIILTARFYKALFKIGCNLFFLFFYSFLGTSLEKKAVRRPLWLLKQCMCFGFFFFCFFLRRGLSGWGLNRSFVFFAGVCRVD